MADISFAHDHPGLRFYTQEEGTDAAVRICEYDGDITADGYVEFPLSGVDIFVVAGRIHATDIVRCSTNLVAQNGIVAAGGVDVYGSIHCCGGGIRSGEGIWAEGRIDLRGGIEAKGPIECFGIGCLDGDIKAEGCIISENEICTNGNIDCGKRIFAGVSLGATNETCRNEIMCDKLLKGEICCGVLAEGGTWQPEEGWC